MARITQALLGATAMGRGHQNAMLNLMYGASNGYAPRMDEWVNAQPYVRKNLICLVVEYPRGLDALPDAQTWIGTYRALHEIHASEITGLAAGLEVEVGEIDYGGSGQKFQVPVRVTRAVSEPQFKFNEKEGLVVNRFFEAYIQNLIADPETQFANINTIATAKVTDMLADRYSGTMIFIEPDATHSFVVKAWLCTNMWPQSSGEVVGQRTPTQGSEVTNYDIRYTAITQYGAGVNALAQRLLDGINISGANAYNRPAFVQDIAAAVKAVGRGYQEGVENLAATAVRV